MEPIEARTMVNALARGINPITGEVFASDSPYNEPRIIRALFTVCDLARLAKRPKLSTGEMRLRNLDQGRPGNAGLPWTDDARKQIGAEFEKGKSVGELAATLERSQGAIQAELIKQGLLPPDFRP